jgi:hypothetical protein
MFIDLSTQVHSVILERYPELAGPLPHDDPTEYLPLPPTTALDWQADALTDLVAAGFFDLFTADMTGTSAHLCKLAAGVSSWSESCKTPAYMGQERPYGSQYP